MLFTFAHHFLKYFRYLGFRDAKLTLVNRGGNLSKEEIAAFALAKSESPGSALVADDLWAL